MMFEYFFFGLATLIFEEEYFLVIVLCTDELGLNLLPLFYEFKIAKLDEQQCIKEKRAAHSYARCSCIICYVYTNGFYVEVGPLIC